MSSHLNSVQTLKLQSYRTEDVSESVQQTEPTLLWSDAHITALEAGAIYMLLLVTENTVPT